MNNSLRNDLIENAAFAALSIQTKTLKLINYEFAIVVI